MVGCDGCDGWVSTTRCVLLFVISSDRHAVPLGPHRRADNTQGQVVLPRLCAYTGAWKTSSQAHAKETVALCWWSPGGVSYSAGLYIIYCCIAVLRSYRESSSGRGKDLRQLRCCCHVIAFSISPICIVFVANIFARS